MQVVDCVYLSGSIINNKASSRPEINIDWDLVEEERKILIRSWNMSTKQQRILKLVHTTAVLAFFKDVYTEKWKPMSGK